MARVTNLRIYPVKSLPGNSGAFERVGPMGTLGLDRRWAFADEEGKFWTSKRTPKMHEFGCESLDWGEGLRFTHRDGSNIILRDYDREQDRVPVEQWFSERIGSPARLLENSEVGFPDDLDSPGPTIVSTATMELIASWFPGLAPENIRQRLRANIEIDGVPAFWEDRLLRADGTPQPFRIGSVVFQGINPCQRCIVPSRDPATGEPLPHFQKTFSDLRRQTLPDWAPVERFSHFYRATVNTRLLSGAGETIHLGTEVEIL